MKAYKGSRGYSSTHSQPWHQMEVSGQTSCPGCFNPREKKTRYPFNMRLGMSQHWSGHFEEKYLAVFGNQI
jgi:hypothetical protein